MLPRPAVFRHQLFNLWSSHREDVWQILYQWHWLIVNSMSCSNFLLEAIIFLDIGIIAIGEKGTGFNCTWFHKDPWILLSQRLWWAQCMNTLPSAPSWTLWLLQKQGPRFSDLDRRTRHSCTFDALCAPHLPKYLGAPANVSIEYLSEAGARVVLIYDCVSKEHLQW